MICLGALEDDGDDDELAATDEPGDACAPWRHGPLGQLSMQLLGMLLAEGEAPVEEVADAGEDDLDLDDLEDDGDDDELAGADAPGDACAPKRRRARRSAAGTNSSPTWRRR